MTSNCFFSPSATTWCSIRKHKTVKEKPCYPSFLAFKSKKIAQFWLRLWRLSAKKAFAVSNNKNSLALLVLHKLLLWLYNNDNTIWWALFNLTSSFIHHSGFNSGRESWIFLLGVGWGRGRHVIKLKQPSHNEKVTINWNASEPRDIF